MLATVSNENLWDSGKTANLAVPWEDEETDNDSSGNDSSPPTLLARGKRCNSDDSNSDSDEENEASDGPPEKQKALTSDLLWDMAKSYEQMGEVGRHTTDLTVEAYFFAMRACEFCKTPRRGKTRLLTLENVEFRDTRKRVIPHDDPGLLRRARFVTITFVDQKNGEKFEKRTQPRTGRKWLYVAGAKGDRTAPSLRARFLSQSI
jgi:hypothetical protein